MTNDLDQIDKALKLIRLQRGDIEDLQAVITEKDKLLREVARSLEYCKDMADDDLDAHKDGIVGKCHETLTKLNEAIDD